MEGNVSIPSAICPTKNRNITRDTWQGTSDPELRVEGRILQLEMFRLKGEWHDSDERLYDLGVKSLGPGTWLPCLQATTSAWTFGQVSYSLSILVSSFLK